MCPFALEVPQLLEVMPDGRCYRHRYGDAKERHEKVRSRAKLSSEMTWVLDWQRSSSIHVHRR